MYVTEQPMIEILNPTQYFEKIDVLTTISKMSYDNWIFYNVN
jgi:hypothetical protein